MATTIHPNEISIPSPSALSLPPLDLTPSTLHAKTAKPSAPRTPRIDIEPLYATLKSHIASDADWAAYKAALAAFLVGNSNQAELSHTFSRILTSAALERAHNALVAGLYANVWRDAPDSGVASWVSSKEKVGAGSGAGGGAGRGQGDERERRVKVEVMGLSRRERKRLKGITNGAAEGGAAAAAGEGDVWLGGVQEYVDARRAKQPELGPGGERGGGFGKTNWDLEIRKRYTAPLSTETHEFPTASSIASRLLPICYEFGLPQGHTPECAEYLNLATETYVKEALASFLGKVWKNGAGLVRTGGFKKRVAREERRGARSLGAPDGTATSAGSAAPHAELPVEAEERRNRKALCLEDLRLALELGDSFLGQTPLLAAGIMNARVFDAHDAAPESEAPHARSLAKASLATNGLLNGAARVNGAAPRALPSRAYSSWSVVLPVDPAVAEEETRSAWQGGSVQEVAELESALDDVLGLGDI